FEGKITPVQAKRGNARVLHGRRSGMPDRMAEYRAMARTGVNGPGGLCCHPLVIVRQRASSKLKVIAAAPSRRRQRLDLWTTTARLRQEKTARTCVSAATPIPPERLYYTS